MEKKFKFGVIGGGYMATLIITGAIKAKTFNNTDFLVCDVNSETLKKFEDLEIATTNNNALIFDSCQFILFAIKPQTFNQISADIGSSKQYKLISIMAGVRIDKIKEYFPNSLVARCMPNAPCAVLNGSSGIDLSDYKNEDDLKTVESLFSASSKVVLVNESFLNTVTGISGSAPAYFYLFVKGIIDSGIKHGLSFEQAKTLAVNTMIGSGKMLLENNNVSIEQLIDSVCSKGGTTIEAIKVFREENLDVITDKAIDACINRSKELENL